MYRERTLLLPAQAPGLYAPEHADGRQGNRTKGTRSYLMLIASFVAVHGDFYRKESEDPEKQLDPGAS